MPKTSNGLSDHGLKIYGSDIDAVTQAKNYEVFGAGFGVLSYDGHPVDLISQFSDSGQRALGSAIDVMTINDRRPRCIIPPMAVGSGTVTFTTYSLYSKGVWGTIFNGRFSDAKELIDIFEEQLSKGAITLVWSSVDIDGRVQKLYTYEGLVVIDAQPNRTVSNNGGVQATTTFTCKYTHVVEHMPK